jgi:superfamily II DNA/RNA helicase
VSQALSFSRREQFLQHRREGDVFDQEREKALTLYLEEEEQWTLRRLEAYLEHKKNKKERAELRGDESYRIHLNEKVVRREEEQELLAEYLRQHKIGIHGSAHGSSTDLSENEELGLSEKRPRYDIKKRVLYGAKPKSTGKDQKAFGKAGGGSSAHSGSDSGFGSGSGGGSGYAPSPSGPEPDFNDFPPPPPMAPMAPYEDSDFPPPPPPPSFEDNEGF